MTSAAFSTMAAEFMQEPTEKPWDVGLNNHSPVHSFALYVYLCRVSHSYIPLGMEVYDMQQNITAPCFGKAYMERKVEINH